MGKKVYFSEILTNRPRRDDARKKFRAASRNGNAMVVIIARVNIF